MFVPLALKMAKFEHFGPQNGESRQIESVSAIPAPPAARNAHVCVNLRDNYIMQALLFTRLSFQRYNLHANPCL